LCNKIANNADWLKLLFTLHHTQFVRNISINQNTITMKKNYLFLLLVLFATKSFACVDYHVPNPVTAKYNQALSELELTIHNLNIFAGADGDFCTCGVISAYESLFDGIYYVAFVDSGTTNLIQGFAPWVANQSASEAWQEHTSSVSPWNAFVAGVIAEMTPGLAVELIIRMNVPDELQSLQGLIEALFSASLATDEWDAENETLAQSHLSISAFGQMTFIEVDDNYFSTSVTELESVSYFSVYPNPSEGLLTLNFSEIHPNQSIEVIDVKGRVIQTLSAAGLNRMDLNLSSLESGYYFLRMRSDNAIKGIERIVIAGK